MVLSKGYLSSSDKAVGIHQKKRLGITALQHVPLHDMRTYNPKRSIILTVNRLVKLVAVYHKIVLVSQLNTIF